MPAFFTAEFWDLANPELWVGVGLILFLGILAFAGAFKAAAAALDAKGAKIQADLDEAARIRAEAETMLADINRQREESEAQAKAMLDAAKDEAKRLSAEAKVKLEQTIARRAALAERKIEAAQAEAAAQVKAAAVDLAARATEAVLARQLAGAKGDPQTDRAIGELAGKLQ
jgi:F-type H+-transporting ATPase subunit b